MTDPNRAAQLARARALSADRARPRGASSATKIMVAGTAASAGLLMVAAMGSAAQNAAIDAPTQVIERMVIIEVPATTVGSTPDATTAPAPAGEVTVVREIRELPAAPDAAPAPAPAPSSGS